MVVESTHREQQVDADIEQVKQQVIGLQEQSAGVGTRLHSLKRNIHALVQTKAKKMAKVSADSHTLGTWVQE